MATAIIGALSALAIPPTLEHCSPDPYGPDWSDWLITSVDGFCTYWDTHGESFHLNPNAVGTVYRNEFAVGNVSFNTAGPLTWEERDLIGIGVNPHMTMSKWNYSILIPEGTLVSEDGRTFNEDTYVHYSFLSLDREHFTKPDRDELTPLFDITSISPTEGSSLNYENKGDLSITWDLKKEIKDFRGTIHTPKRIRVDANKAPKISLTVKRPDGTDNIGVPPYWIYDKVYDWETTIGADGKFSLTYTFKDNTPPEWEAYGDVTITIPSGLFYDEETMTTNKEQTFEYRLDYCHIDMYSDAGFESYPSAADIIDRSNGTPLDEIRIKYTDLFYYNFKTPERMKVPEGETLTLEYHDNDWENYSTIESDPIQCIWESDDCVILIIPFKSHPLTESGWYCLPISPGLILTQARPSIWDHWLDFEYIAPNKPIEPIEPDPVEPEDPDHVKLTADIAGHGIVIAHVAKAKPIEIHLTPADGWSIDRVMLDNDELQPEETECRFILPPLEKASSLHVSYAYDPEVQIVDATTGVSAIDGSSYSIEVTGGQALITGLIGGEQIKLYAINGALIDSIQAKADTVKIVLRRGAHIITIDDRHAVKVII